MELQYSETKIENSNAQIWICEIAILFRKQIFRTGYLQKSKNSVKFQCLSFVGNFKIQKVLPLEKTWEIEKKNHLFLGVKGCGNWLKFDPIGARSCTFDRIFLPVRRLYPENFKSKMPASIAKSREICQIFNNK